MISKPDAYEFEAKLKSQKVIKAIPDEVMHSGMAFDVHAFIRSIIPYNFATLLVASTTVEMMTMIGMRDVVQICFVEYALVLWVELQLFNNHIKLTTMKKLIFNSNIADVHVHRLDAKSKDTFGCIRTTAFKPNAPLPLTPDQIMTDGTSFSALVDFVFGDAKGRKKMSIMKCINKDALTFELIQVIRDAKKGGQSKREIIKEFNEIKVPSFKEILRKLPNPSYSNS